ncbi:MAG: Co2+/Mg2+ efflux protein ApaG [Sphingomonadaceae bacterium]
MLDSFFDHAAMTDGITVRVSVSYLPEQSAPEEARWFWAYHVRVENHSDRAVQLLTRHWRITDAGGGVNLVEGEGVVGEQPVLRPGEAHDYVSGCPLPTPWGSMEGRYTFVVVDGPETGQRFEAAIPFFPLEAGETAQ